MRLNGLTLYSALSSMALKTKYGLTQLELLLVLAIVGILSALGLPALQTIAVRNELIKVSELVAADLRWARSEALKRGVPVSVQFTSGAAGTWSYVINVQAADSEPLKTVNLAHYPELEHITLTDNFKGHNTLFDPLRGATEGLHGTVVLNATRGDYQVKIILGNVGRVRICTTTEALGGYPAC